MQCTSIHTTVNLGFAHALLLNASARKLGVKRSQLIVLLMEKLLLLWKSMKRSEVTVQYQKKFSFEEWKVVHVFLTGQEYEVFTDMRNFFKRSVSYMLAIAIRKFLQEILDDGKEKFQSHCDNYEIINYKRTGKFDKNYICWHINWILGEKLAKKLCF